MRMFLSSAEVRWMGQDISLATCRTHSHSLHDWAQVGAGRPSTSGRCKIINFWGIGPSACLLAIYKISIKSSQPLTNARQRLRILDSFIPSPHSAENRRKRT